MRKLNHIRIFIGVIIFSIFWEFGDAQDIHFSQFYNSPLYINPALCGVIDGGNIRVASNYKDQWKSITPNSYKTYTGSFDMLISSEKKHGIAGGLSYYNDKAGTSNFGTSQFNATLGYVAKLNDVNYFSAAISSGYGNRSAKISNLKWESQFDGNAYNPNASNGEINPYSESRYFSDFSGGLLWNYRNTEGSGAEFGFSAFHVNRPNISLYNAATDRMYSRIVLHGSINYALKNSNTSILPKLFYSQQGPSKELLAGMLISYELGMTSKYTGLRSSSSIAFGSFYRTRDAVVLVFNTELKKKILIGISYDINISNLTMVSYGKGGLEVSLIYKGTYKGLKTAAEGGE